VEAVRGKRPVSFQGDRTFSTRQWRERQEEFLLTDGVGVEFSVGVPVDGGGGKAREEPQVGDALGNQSDGMLVDVTQGGAQSTPPQAIPVFVNSVYTPLSGVPRFPIPRSANSDSPLKHHDLYGKQKLRRRRRAPLKAILRLMALRFKACILYLHLKVL